METSFSIFIFFNSPENLSRLQKKSKPFILGQICSHRTTKVYLKQNVDPEIWISFSFTCKNT